MAETLALQAVCLWSAVIAVMLCDRRAARVELAEIGVFAFVLIDALSSRLFGAISKGALLFGMRSGWGWDGKLLAIAGAVTLIALLPSLSFRSTGLVLKQKPGSLAPAVAATFLLCALLWGDNLIAGTPKLHIPTLGTLIFQAMMPGLQEELEYRGIMLALFDRAFPARRWSLFGARIGWGTLLTSLIFGLGHGLMFDEHGLVFAPRVILVTGAVGFLLAWIRARSGSLLMPVVAHNLANVGVQFL